MRIHLALALVLPLASVALACAPTHADGPEVERQTAEAKPKRTASRARAPASPRPRAISRKGPTIGCGRIVLQPTGRWTRNERLAAIREEWHPRAEHGRPVGIRTVSAPVPVPGHELFQVKVEHSPRVIQPCWLSLVGSEHGGWSRNECLSPQVVVPQMSSESRPRRAEDLATLLGTFDDATAVYASEAELDRCVEGLPAAVRAKVPPLGRRHHDGEEHVTFVEWIDVDDLSLLLSVHATLEPTVEPTVEPTLGPGPGPDPERAQLDLERHELMRIDHRGGER